MTLCKKKRERKKIDRERERKRERERPFPGFSENHVVIGPGTIAGCGIDFGVLLYHLDDR